jgi:hypothetical protein
MQNFAGYIHICVKKQLYIIFFLAGYIPMCVCVCVCVCVV